MGGLWEISICLTLGNDHGYAKKWGDFAQVQVISLKVEFFAESTQLGTYTTLLMYILIIMIISFSQCNCFHSKATNFKPINLLDISYCQIFYIEIYSARNWKLKIEESFLTFIS